MAKDKIIKGKTKRTRKKKLTCCQRCRRRICRWFYRRTKRCCKKAIFGVPDPRLSDYEIAGLNLADLKRKRGKSIKDSPENKKKSVVILYKSKKHSTISMPLKEKLKQEYDISKIKPKGSYKKNILSDLKERNLYVGLSKNSKLGLTKSDKDKFSQMAKQYEEKYKKRSMLDDLEKYKKSSFLKKYEGKYKNVSLSDLKELKNMNKDNLKKNLSITSSKHGVLKNMLSDYEKKKFSLTGLFSKSKPNLDQLDKEDVKKILEVYKEKEKRKNYTFVKQSKIKQLKSDLRAKLAGIG